MKDEDEHTLSVSVMAQARRADEPPALARGEVLDQRYEIQRELGRGAAARVYQAYDRATRSAVALKVMFDRGPNDRPWRERLGRELRLAREVRHPNVCEVYDLTEAGGHRFLTMALATRGTLRDSLNGAGSTDPLADLRGVIAGLAALHGAGIVHRDVKPENVLRMEDGRVVLSDFGLAVDPERVTVETHGVGTPAYMAPEVLAGEPATMRSDVWAAGIILYETLFGARPGPEKPGTRQERRVSRSLRALSTWCLQPVPDKRPADARELLKAFERATSGRRPLAVSRRWWALVPAGLAVLAGVYWTVVRRSDGIRQLSIVSEPGSLAGHVRALASFPGRVHCSSALPDGSIGVVWGEPRKAERVLPQSGARIPWNLPPEAFQFATKEFELPDPIDNNCPQISPDGKQLLYTSTTTTGQRSVVLSDLPTGTRVLLNSGDAPAWHPGGQLIALRVDYGHVGIFHLPNRQLFVLPDPARPGMRGLNDVLQMVFSEDGRSLLVRVSDEGGYNLVRYETERYRITEHLFIPYGGHSPYPTFGAAVSGQTTITAAMPGGTYGLASVSWQPGEIRWLGQLPPSDLTALVQNSSSGLTLIARRKNSELQVIRQGRVIRSLSFDSPPVGGGSDVDSAGNVVVSASDGGRFSVLLYPAGETTPRRLGSGPTDGHARFTPDGRGVIFGHESGSPKEPDSIIRCTLDNQCAVVARVPSANYPALSPDGERIAFLGFVLYQHAAILTVATGAVQILAPAALCPPRWLHDKLWVAQGAKDSLDWVELNASDGHPTGRRVAGRPGCGAVEPGPENVLEEKLRQIDREESQVLAWDGQVTH